MIIWHDGSDPPIGEMERISESIRATKWRAGGAMRRKMRALSAGPAARSLTRRCRAALPSRRAVHLRFIALLKPPFKSSSHYSHAG
jgi:hypothetical protein